jgi:hypothetical protein
MEGNSAMGIRVMTFRCSTAKSLTTGIPMILASGQLHHNGTCFPAYGEGKRAPIHATDNTVNDEVYENQPKRGFMFHAVKALIDNDAAPEEIAQAIPWRKNHLFLKLEGELDSEGFIEEVMKTDAGGKVPKFKRYFYRDDELFRYKGNTYALTNQWGKGALEAVLLLNDAFQNVDITLAEAT